MSAIVLLDATILRPPVRRESNRGRHYAMTTVVVGRGEDAEFWKVVVFGRGAEDFLSLRNGDEITVTGPLRTELTGPADAPTGIALSVVAESWAREASRQNVGVVSTTPTGMPDRGAS